MGSVVPSFGYDIFISYRQKDNKRERWVTHFVEALRTELEATFKEDISIYFDENAHDGLLPNHDVEESLKGKLRCLVFIPIISQTYCDEKSFAWRNEFAPFKRMATEDEFGLKVKLANGNVASRILPICIHELEARDKQLMERELGGVLRSIEFIYKEAGVNRPLKPSDSKLDNLNKTDYVNQINKVANSIKEIISVLKTPVGPGIDELLVEEKVEKNSSLAGLKKILSYAGVLVVALLVLFLYPKFFKKSDEPEKSIAVLRFDDLSPSKDQQYFSDGIAEEILNRLVQIEGLKVPGFTSTINFKGKQDDLREIREKLNVNYFLRGSVRRIGDRAKISVKMISAADGYPLWSQEFDRDLNNLSGIKEFAIEEEVGMAVAEKLQLTFLQRPVGEKSYTQNKEAFDNYLRGNYFWNRRDLESAEKYFGRAVQLDSNFALGYEGLAKTYVISQFFGNSNEMPKVVKSANKAVELDSTLAVPYLCLAMKNTIHDWRPEVARKYFLKALRLNPKYAPIHYWYGQFLILYGGPKDLPEAISEMRIGLELDPQNASSHHNMGLALMYTKRYPEAAKEFKTSIELNSSFRIPPTNLGLTYFAMSNFEESKKAFELGDQLKNDLSTCYLSYFYMKQGDRVKALTVMDKLREMAKTSYVHDLSFAVTAWYLGDKDLANSYFKKAVDNHDCWLPYYLKDSPVLAPNLLLDPRNRSLVPKILGGIGGSE